MPVITRNHILQQLKADLIGKDAYRGVTLTYAWMANQFGHFSLGFIPSFLLYLFLRTNNNYQNPSIWAAIFVSIAWLLFEMYNFLGPLLLVNKSKGDLKLGKETAYQFKPDWVNIAFDTFTDLCFFWLGAFTLNLVVLISLNAFYLIVPFLLLIIFACRYWFLTKMYQQEAKYPFQFRISQWKMSISNRDKATVQAFMKSANTSGKHLLICGYQGAGKTSMAVGIANEQSIKHKACSYVTAVKLFSMFIHTENSSSIINKWDWRNSHMLVIDDVNPGYPVKKELITPELFLQMMDNFSTPNEANRLYLKNKNCIWILGNHYSEKMHKNNWEWLLKNIGVQPADIFSIDLSA